MNWYEELWEKIGGRPWTYIISQHRELLEEGH